MAGPYSSGVGSAAVSHNPGIISTGTNATFNFTTPVDSSEALAGLPRRSPVFTGRRQELEMLLERLAPAAGPPHVVIAGMGGVGKTELAIQGASSALERGLFPGGVLYYDLRGYNPAQEATSDEVLGSWLSSLGVPIARIPPNPQGKQAQYRTKLKALADLGRPVLVLIDNASKSDQVTPLLPSDSATGAIVTSRHFLSPLRIRVQKLRPLGPDASVELLEASLRAVRDPQWVNRRTAGHRGHAEEIARLCGYLPLALVTFGAQLARPGSPPLADSARYLADVASRLDELSESEPHDVRATLAMSYRVLDDTQRRVLQFLSACPGADVPAEMLAEALGDLEGGGIRRALVALADAHLAELSRPGHWHMHDLARLYAAEVSRQAGTFDLDRERALRRYLETIRLADDHLRVLPGEATPPGRFRDRDDALNWLNDENANFVAGVTAASSAGGLDGLALDLALSLGMYLAWSHRYEDLHTVSAIALEAAERSGGRHQASAAAYSKGLASRGLGRPGEAVAAFEQAIAGFRATGDRHGEGLAYTGLGLARWEAGDFAAALAAHQRADEIFRETRDQYGRNVGLDRLMLPRADV